MKKLIYLVMIFLIIWSQAGFADNSGSASVNQANTSISATADQLSNYYFNEYKKHSGWSWLETTNIGFNLFSGATPQFYVSTFQPLSLKNKLDAFYFAQAQYVTANNTLNLGLGYRALNASRSALYGANLFYDLQSSVSSIGNNTPSGIPMRVGMGLEYFSGSIESRVNAYYGVSSDINVATTSSTTDIYEHVAPGVDVSIGTDFAFINAPWLKLAAIGSYYAQTQSGTINGYNGSPLFGSITAALQVTPQLSITAGDTIGNGSNGSANIGAQFNLLAPPQPALLWRDDTINQLAKLDISYKMLQPVQRNNVITMEQYTKQVVNPPIPSGSAIVRGLVVNGANNIPMPGVSVSLVDNNGDAATCVSDQSGNYQFNNIAAGAYTLNAHISTANDYSISVDVADSALLNQTINMRGVQSAIILNVTNYTRSTLGVNDGGKIAFYAGGGSYAKLVSIGNIAPGATVQYKVTPPNLPNDGQYYITYRYVPTGSPYALDIGCSDSIPTSVQSIARYSITSGGEYTINILPTIQTYQSYYPTGGIYTVTDTTTLAAASSGGITSGNNAIFVYNPMLIGNIWSASYNLSTNPNPTPFGTAGTSDNIRVL